MKNVQIFEHKGHVGISINPDAKYINDPKGQLGVLVDTKDVAITKEAKEIISKAPKGDGSFSELMLTKHSGDEPSSANSSIGILGFNKVHLEKGFEIGRECDVSVLEDCSEEELETPEDFKEYINSL